MNTCVPPLYIVYRNQFLSRAKPNKIWIVFATFFRLIWHQTKFRMISDYFQQETEIHISLFRKYMLWINLFRTKWFWIFWFFNDQTKIVEDIKIYVLYLFIYEWGKMTKIIFNSDSSEPFELILLFKYQLIYLIKV